MQDFSDCYAALEVTPDTDWKTLRANYKRLIGRWHPDRFSADPARKDIAEERCKRITLAYQALEQYRREHGVLPLIAHARNQEPDIGTASDRTGTEDRAGTVTEETADRTHAPRKPEHRYRVAIVLTIFVAAIYLFSRDPNAVTPHDNQAADSDTDTVTQAPPVAQTAGESGGISIGSTLGEVYSIQGVPTLTQGDTWYYGKSQVRFSKGQVISWEEHPDNPLRIAPDQPVFSGDRQFGMGSTKEHVREIQGVPVTATETVWDYGSSRVYFEHNRVVRWEASPLQPLRVPH